MEEKNIGKMPLDEFIDKLLEADDIFEAIKKERQESKLYTTTLIQQRKEILKGLMGKNKDENR